jgi:hypothetical protein
VKAMSFRPSVVYRSVLRACAGRYLSIMGAAIVLAIAYAPATRAQITNLTNGSTINFSNLGTGQFSILVGDKLFSDFSLSNYNASNINVMGITEDGGDFGIQFQGGFFSMNGSMDVILSYTVSVTNSANLISGANLSFNGFEFGSNGVAEVTETIDTNNSLYGDMTVYASPSSNVLATSLAIIPPQSQLELTKDVFTYAIDLSFASISTINQSYMQVPEPSTMMLAIAGLAGLLMLRRRRH